MGKKFKDERPGVVWDDDDFNLDSHGVEAPEEDVFELLAEQGYKPEDVNEEALGRYAAYLEWMRNKGTP
jgi:hypothetical protein